MVRLAVVVLLVCCACIAVAFPMNDDDLEIGISVDHDHSHHQHDHSDSSDSDSDDSHDHHHHLEQGLDLANGTCKEKAERLLKYLWQRFKARYAKHFSHSEDRKRIKIFGAALERIQKHNMEADLGIHTFQMGLNEYSCATPEEKAGMRGLIPEDNRNSENEFQSTIPVSQLPESLDWTQRGYVTPVKNQKNCGCCYTFAAIGALEAQYKNTTGQLVSLSEQQLLDCSSNSAYGNNGCNGGVCNYAFKYAKDVGYLIKNEDYSYKEKKESCKASKDKAVPRTQVTKWVDVKRGSEESLMTVLANVGPVSVAVDASTEFQNYRYGIYTGKSSNLNHAVLLVGYGTENGRKYWKIKNSWGPTWGENGYIRVSRGSNDNNANCGVTLQASAPVM